MNVAKDYYSILDIPMLGATPQIIKAQFRKMALMHHPDKGGDPEKFKEINEAFSVLSDANLKGLYDDARSARVVRWKVRIDGSVFNSAYTTNTNTGNYW